MKNSQKGSATVVLLVLIVVILLVVIGYSYVKPAQPQIIETSQLENNSESVTTNPVPEVTTNLNMSGGKNSAITVVSPNGGERIPYGNITMAGDLSFTWKLQNENFKPTSEFAAYLIDENNLVIRSDFVKYINPIGKGIFMTSFSGEKNIEINKKYKIRVCDEVDTRIVECDESDDYFTVVSR